ncbi:hypothetical protein BEWA_010030 [Theileria equi strain WA]|uniref:Uncharacterized protein n=1 Tax=Theileria equi strain WA TaxID=1537102 RepID=L0B393_THEEQ|nr:hypothetical protein BEWA_010030 [Theileria equi strain WA]AFZ81589.1 hypothetical protein BEWA_010030 [Theileria equi strain WA]|eukprot:XP_004831255.1 hypothetical protein BEWA_010030 [Theileria equi strain WA]
MYDSHTDKSTFGSFGNTFANTTQNLNSDKNSEIFYQTDLIRADNDDNGSPRLNEWYDVGSKHLFSARDKNSPSQTNYSENSINTQEYTTLSLNTECNSQYELNTVNNKDQHSDGDNTSSLGLIATPNISFSGYDSILDPINTKLVDLGSFVYDSTTTGNCTESIRNGFYIDDNDELFYVSNNLVESIPNKIICNFLDAVTSDEIFNDSEDWGIDRSIYTRYSRSGFFADCYNADMFYHGEYLNNLGMKYFAECRMPLTFCIIMTDRHVRKNEVQTGIVPLAINLLDRFMAKQTNPIAKIIAQVYSKINEPCEQLKKMIGTSFTSDDVNTGLNLDLSLNERDFNSEQFGIDLVDQEYDIKNIEKCHWRDDLLLLKVELVYNFITAACYFIADRYNGLANISVKTLLNHWISSCKVFTKTKNSSRFIINNKEKSLSIIMSLMFEIYNALDYKVTVPFVSYMVQNLIISSNDVPYSQNPRQHNNYQIIGLILSRIALIDDTFHRFTSSIISLSIYTLVRKLAIHDGVVSDEGNTWLIVDESNLDIKECTTLLAKTLFQFVNTEILDVLVQPIVIRDGNEDLFNFILQGDVKHIDMDNIRQISKILSS